MGMFCLPRGDKSGDLVECAIGNLQIFLEDWKHDRGTIYCSQPYPNDYLLRMAIGCIEDAIKQYEQECANNPNVNPPREPDPIVDLDLALQHANGNEVEDCSMILLFVGQHMTDLPEIDKFMKILIERGAGWTAGMCSVLRYTWQTRDQLTNWYNLREACKISIENSGGDPNDGLCGLLDLKPETV